MPNQLSENQIDIEQEDNNLEIQRIDLTDAEFLPSLEQCKNKQKSKNLVKEVKELSEYLNNETALVKNKLDIYPELLKQLNLLPKEDRGTYDDKIDIDTFKSQFLLLADAYNSSNPFLAAKELLETNFSDTPDHISSPMNVTYSIRERIFALFSSKHKRIIEKLQSIAKETISKMIFNIIHEILNIIEKLHKDIEKTENDFSIEWNRFCDCNESELQNSKNSIGILIDRYKKLTLSSEKINKLIKFLLKNNNVCNDTHSELKYERFIDQLKYEQERLVNKLTQCKERIESISKSNITGLLDKKCWDIWKKLKLFDSEENKYKLTKEFIEAFNQLIKKKNEAQKILSSSKLPIYYYPTDSIREAREISKGRLATHTSNTEWMYEVLTRGQLLSVVEQQKRTGQKRRLNKTYQKERLLENHELSFAMDYIHYKSCPIAIIFSENLLLSNGYQYYDADGSHIFDPSFQSENMDSPGLALDLKDIPCMIMVVESERETFIEFLKTKSIWSMELQSMPDIEFSKWLQYNIIFVDILSITPEVKQRFNQTKNIKPVKGYIIETDYESKFATGEPHKLMRFIPTEKLS